MQVVEQSHQILFPEELGNVSSEILKLIELAGRTAYKSEGRITESSAEKFIANIIERGHESVIEHFNITVKFITDRGITHEIVRHRLVAYTQESTRYCNYSKLGMEFIKPPFWGPGAPRGKGQYSTRFYQTWCDHMRECERVYNLLINNGATPQEARSVLPNSLKTEIVCTTNVREWRHILKLRCSKAAHPQMRQLMIPLLREFKKNLPILFNDISEE